MSNKKCYNNVRLLFQLFLRLFYIRIQIAKHLLSDSFVKEANKQLIQILDILCFQFRQQILNVKFQQQCETLNIVKAEAAV